MLISRTDRGYARSSNGRRLSIIFIVLLVLFFVLKPLLQPVLLSLVSSVSGIFSSKTVAALEIENENLKNQLAIFEKDFANASSTEELLKIGATDFIRASIIVKNMNNVYGSMYIGVGTRDGVSVDTVVFVSGLHPIGRVVGVSEKFSRIELFTGSDKKLGGILRYASSSEEVLELQGDGAYGFVSMVPANSSIQNGDKIYFSEDPEFVIGQVLSVDINENENNKIVRVKSFYSTSGTASVYIQR